MSGGDAVRCSTCQPVLVAGGLAQQLVVSLPLALTCESTAIASVFLHACCRTLCRGCVRPGLLPFTYCSILGMVQEVRMQQ
jgi:hypothetical protein